MNAVSGLVHLLCWQDEDELLVGVIPFVLTLIRLSCLAKPVVNHLSFVLTGSLLFRHQVNSAASPAIISVYFTLWPVLLICTPHDSLGPMCDLKIVAGCSCSCRLKENNNNRMRKNG